MPEVSARACKQLRREVTRDVCQPHTAVDSGAFSCSCSNVKGAGSPRLSQRSGHEQGDVRAGLVCADVGHGVQRRGTESPPSHHPRGPEMQEGGASGFIPFAAPSQLLSVFVSSAGQPPIHLHLGTVYGYKCTWVFIKTPPIRSSVGLDCSRWKNELFPPFHLAGNPHIQIWDL